MKPTAEEINYLIDAAELNLNIKTTPEHLAETFAGVRTMPIIDKHQPFKGQELKSEWIDNPFASPAYLQSSEGLNISALSRETVIDEAMPGLFSIYGGKYTTYRAECEKLAASLCRRLGRGGQSTTCTADAWFIQEILQQMPEIFVSSASTRSI